MLVSRKVFELPPPDLKKWFLGDLQLGGFLKVRAWISRSLRQLSHASETSQSFAGSDSTGPNFTSTLRKFNAWEDGRNQAGDMQKFPLETVVYWTSLDTVDGLKIRKKTSWYGRYPIICRVLYTTGGAGFLLSRVCVDIEFYDSYDARKQHMQPFKCYLFGSRETPLQKQGFFSQSKQIVIHL